MAIASEDAALESAIKKQKSGKRKIAKKTKFLLLTEFIII